MARRARIWFLPVLLCLAAASTAHAQDSVQHHHPASISSLWPNWPKARPEDVQSVNSVISCYFAVLSGDAKTPRDWNRFKSLFLPDGRLIDIKTWYDDPHLIPAVFDLQRLTEILTVNLRKGDFEEHPVDIQMHVSGSLIQAIVTSETRINVATGVRKARFLYSFELIKDVDRYWIVEVLEQPISGSGRPE